MSYAKGTMLRRDEPKGDKFDLVRVVGQSPISSSAAASAWGGNARGDLLIVEPVGLPAEFYANELITVDALNAQFTVEWEPDPEPTHVESNQRRTAVRQLSPEEQFRIAAKSGYDEEQTRANIERQRTPIRSRAR
jgi:hypothetical protein